MQTNFPELITGLCEKAGSEEKFSRQIGVNADTVRRWKKGVLPPTPTLERLVDELKLTIIIKPSS